jgi:hypothetical protein
MPCRRHALEVSLMEKEVRGRSEQWPPRHQHHEGNCEVDAYSYRNIAVLCTVTSINQITTGLDAHALPVTAGSVHTSSECFDHSLLKILSRTRLYRSFYLFGHINPYRRAIAATIYGFTLGNCGVGFPYLLSCDVKAAASASRNLDVTIITPCNVEAAICK